LRNDQAKKVTPKILEIRGSDGIYVSTTNRYFDTEGMEGKDDSCDTIEVYPSMMCVDGALGLFSFWGWFRLYLTIALFIGLILPFLSTMICKQDLHALYDSVTHETAGTIAI